MRASPRSAVALEEQVPIHPCGSLCRGGWRSISSPLQPLIGDRTESIRDAALQWLGASVGSAFQLASTLVVVVFLVFFLLLEGNHFRERLVEVTGP